ATPLTVFPYTTLFRSQLQAFALIEATGEIGRGDERNGRLRHAHQCRRGGAKTQRPRVWRAPVLRAREYIVNAFTSPIPSFVPERSEEHTSNSSHEWIS